MDNTPCIAKHTAIFYKSYNFYNFYNSYNSYKTYTIYTTFIICARKKSAMAVRCHGGFVCEDGLRVGYLTNIFCPATT